MKVWSPDWYVCGTAGVLAGVFGVLGTFNVFSTARAVLIGRPLRRKESPTIVWCAAGPSPGTNSLHVSNNPVQPDLGVPESTRPDAPIDAAILRRLQHYLIKIDIITSAQLTLPILLDFLRHSQRDGHQNQIWLQTSDVGMIWLRTCGDFQRDDGSDPHEVGGAGHLMSQGCHRHPGLSLRGAARGSLLK